MYNRTGKPGLWIDDPVTVAIYARDNGLLDQPGWKLPELKKMAKTQKKLLRLANKAKLHSFHNKHVYMCGFQVPHNHVEAMELDRMNGNSMWRDAEITELNQIDEYKSFIDKGVGFNPGSDFKKIRVHMVYAVKHDGRHKAQLVAGGHPAETPTSEKPINGKTLHKGVIATNKHSKIPNLTANTHKQAGTITKKSPNAPQ